MKRWKTPNSKPVEHLKCVCWEVVYEMTLEPFLIMQLCALPSNPPGLLLLRAGSASSYDGFVLPRPLWGLLMQSARKSSDIKYNRGERSRKSYGAGMNSFPFELVPFSFNLLLSASCWPESSLCFSCTPEGSSESAARWPHLREPNTCSVLQVLQSISPPPSPPTLQQDLV